MRSILSIALAGLLTGAAAGAQAFRLDTGTACEERRPDVAALPDGRFVAVWQQGEEPEAVSRPRVYARLFNNDGTLPGPEILVSAVDRGHSPQVAVNGEGRILVVWLDEVNRVRYRAFGPTGASLGPDRPLPTNPFVTGFALTATRDGGFAIVTTLEEVVVLWQLGPTGQPPVASRLLDAPSFSHPPFADPAVAPYGPSGVVAAWVSEDLQQRTRTLVFGVVPPGTGPVERVLETVEPFDLDDWPRPRPAVAANAAGQVLAAWNRQGGPGAEAGLRAQVFGAGRQPVGPRLEFGGWEVDGVSAPEALATAAGDFVLSWQRFTSGPAVAIGSVARIGPHGALLEPVLDAWNTSGFEKPALTLGSAGQALVVWQTGDLLPGQPPVCFSGGLHAREIPLSPEVLFLRDGRFEARVHWTGHTGGSGDAGEGIAGQLTPDSGSFWFFARENLELVVKVLDGRGVNGSFWVFYASLTDVAFTLEVKDRLTGQTRTYENAAGRLASRADTAAFPAAAPVSDKAAGIASRAAGAGFPGTEGPDPTEGPCTPPELQRHALRPGLCLGGRFEVEVAWTANGGTGGTGAGQGVLLTRDTGHLWFFDPANIELVVKVVDGRAVNGHFWIFYGALTDVEYTVLVRDTATGQERTYHNPAGQLASRADTTAF